MRSIATSLAAGVVNIVFPARCVCCKKQLPAGADSSVCGCCLGGIKPYPGRPGHESSGIRTASACLYEGPAKELVHEFKYSHKRHLARLMSSYMLSFIRNDPDMTKDIDIITCVPLHGRTLRQRGFNQSELLGSRLASELGIEYMDLLRKVIPTRHQNELPREKRLVNLSGSFRAKDAAAAKISASGILIVDDVMTTGATVNECAKALVASGAKTVRAVTFARGA